MLVPPSPTPHHIFTMRPAVSFAPANQRSDHFPSSRVKSFTGGAYENGLLKQEETRPLQTPWQVAQQTAPSQDSYPSYRSTPHGRKRSSHELEETNDTQALNDSQLSIRLPTIEALRGRPSRPTLVSSSGFDQLSVQNPLPLVAAALTRAVPRQASPFNSTSQELTPRSASDTATLKRRASPTAGSDDGSASPTQPGCAVSTGKKRQRYLRDVDRRSIILRIENGEKQAALAREFGVTRAAICHIKKNRDEIISRYDSLLKSAQEMERAGVTISGSPRNDEPPMVQELSRQSVVMLLTTLRDATTPPRAYRLAANRLIMILLEEALAGVLAVDCEVAMANGATVHGVKPDPGMYCIAVGQKGLPLLRLYHQIEPNRAVGCIHVRSGRRGSCTEVDRLDLPRELTPNSSVLLLSSTSATGDSVCAALEALVELGVAEDRIRVVLVACTGVAIEHICGQFPGVRILASVIEAAAVDPNAPGTTTLGNFLRRYNDVKLEQVEQLFTTPATRPSVRRQYDLAAVVTRERPPSPHHVPSNHRASHGAPARHRYPESR